MAPLLGLVRVLKILDNSCDYSIQNTAGQTLFLPTSREAKYKAKAAIECFFLRFGDVLQAGVVYAGTALGFVSLRLPHSTSRSPSYGSGSPQSSPASISISRHKHALRRSRAAA